MDLQLVIPPRNGMGARRRFLGDLALGLCGAGLGLAAGCDTRRPGRVALRTPHFMTRGVVISAVDDIPAWDWPQQAAAAGLSTIATHKHPHEVAAFAKTEAWQSFTGQCARLGIEVEHELHAVADLLPRDLFVRNPEMFRMNEKGERTPDANLCVHSREALEVASENAVRYARVLRPTTGRYFFWIDDWAPMCDCPKCRTYSNSDQAVLLENALLAALQREDPRATLAHLAYGPTLAPPTEVRPDRGLFLEWAPIQRKLDASIAAQPALLDGLDANLEIFPRDTAQVLDYWLDESKACGYRRERPIALPWHGDVFRQDLDAYGERGVRNITTFAVWVNGDYVRQVGKPPLEEYGRELAQWKRGKAT